MREMLRNVEFTRLGLVSLPRRKRDAYAVRLPPGLPLLSDCLAGGNAHAYALSHALLHRRAPRRVKRHRRYFMRWRRGAGEDAFHAFWWMLMREFRPARMLEIGVYRAQTISLWVLISQLEDISCRVVGLSGFDGRGDSTTDYTRELDYQADIAKSFRRFNLPAATLVRALSTEPAGMELISRGPWDLIYIDGGHDYETVRSDVELARRGLQPGGFLVLDDASAETPYQPRSYATAGHPGPSRAAAELKAQWPEGYFGELGHLQVFRASP